MRDSSYALKTIQEALQQSPTDIILTPEYMFFDKNRQIKIIKTSQGFELDPRTDTIQKETVAKLQELASNNKCHIFAATFCESVENAQYGFANTMLHIDKNGKIVGIKRKMMVPEGDFTVKKDGKEYKVMPIICGEIMENSVINQEKSNKKKDMVYEGGVQEWVKQGAPYDILLHPQEQADFNAPAAASALQRGKVSTEAEKFATNVFHVYYDNYIPYLRKGAPIATADVREIAGVFTGDETPLNEYLDTSNYTKARIQR